MSKHLVARRPDSKQPTEYIMVEKKPQGTAWLFWSFIIFMIIVGLHFPNFWRKSNTTEEKPQATFSMHEVVTKVQSTPRCEAYHYCFIIVGTARFADEKYGEAIKLVAFESGQGRDQVFFPNDVIPKIKDSMAVRYRDSKLQMLDAVTCEVLAENE